MRRLALAVALFTACSSGDPTLNVADEAGLEDVRSVEVEVVDSGDQQRWLTITQPLAGQIAAELAADLPVVAGPPCDPTFEIRLFVTGADPVALAYGCNGRPFLWGDQDFWDDRMAEAPPAFVELLSVQISLLSQL